MQFARHGPAGKSGHPGSCCCDHRIHDSCTRSSWGSWASWVRRSLRGSPHPGPDTRADRRPGGRGCPGNRWSPDKKLINRQGRQGRKEIANQKSIIKNSPYYYSSKSSPLATIIFNLFSPNSKFLLQSVLRLAPWSWTLRLVFDLFQGPSPYKLRVSVSPWGSLAFGCGSAALCLRSEILLNSPA